MSSEAQITANQLNAQHSTGPKTEVGKAASCMNNFRFGFTGVFTVLASEDQDEFDHLFHSLSVEHQPKTMTERILVEKMAQHHWLSKRAQRLQDGAMDDPALTPIQQERQFSLFLRYETTNNRAFHRCLNDLLRIKAERRRSEIGFESQKQKQAQESRREAAEKRKHDEAARRQRAEDRKEETHKWDVLLAEAKLDHQMVLTNNLELDRSTAQSAENEHRAKQKAA